VASKAFLGLVPEIQVGKDGPVWKGDGRNCRRKEPLRPGAGIRQRHKVTQGEGGTTKPKNYMEQTAVPVQSEGGPDNHAAGHAFPQEASKVTGWPPVHVTDHVETPPAPRLYPIVANAMPAPFATWTVVSN
jgi:hypothetical protein